MFTAALGEQRSFWTQTLASGPPEGLTHTLPVCLAWGGKARGRPGAAGSSLPPSPPLPALFPGSGEGRVGALSPAPANPAWGQRSFPGEVVTLAPAAASSRQPLPDSGGI